MRSRPRLHVRHHPPRPRPGEEVHFDIELTGLTDTPVDEVRARLMVFERRAVTPIELIHVHFDERSRWGPLQLHRDEKRHLHFDVKLPADLPASWVSDASTVRHLLEVEIDIPWWPGRTETFEIFVDRPPHQPQGGPRAVSSAPAGPRGTELVLEAALSDQAAPFDGEVRGAIAVENSGFHALKQLDVSLVVVDSAHNAAEGRDVLRSAALVLCEGQPVAGASYPFSIQLPPSGNPGYSGALGSVRWFLEARAVRAGLAGNLTVRVPLDVYQRPAQAERETGPMRTGRVAPLGRDRRARNWSEVARLTGLESDPEKELMRGEFGPVALTGSLERRKEQLMMVSELSWARLGLELTVLERQWTDRFMNPALPLGDPEFDARFTARARSAGQREAFLSRRVRRALQAFDQITLDDEGATLASAGSGDQVQNLEAFVTAACDAARAIAVGVRELPVPEGLDAWRDRWAAYAQALGATFTAGDFSIHRARHREARVELVTRFSATGDAIGAAARVLLDRRLAEPIAVPAEAQRVLESISKELPGVRIEPVAVEAAVAFPLDEPSRVEPTWRALQRLAQALVPPAAAAPEQPPQPPSGAGPGA